MTTPIPAQGAGRIRWEDEPGGYAVTEDGFIGPAELNWRAFRIWRPDLRVDPRPFLTSDLRGQERRQVHGTPDELKAEAERWLSEFVQLLGAVFPPGEISDDEDGEPLEVKYAAGRRVRFEHPDNGYAADRLMAATFLTPGEVYTISRADVGQSSTRLDFAGIDTRRQGFNSVLFEPVDDGTPPATAGPAGED
jgi:hypothetical protein